MSTIFTDGAARVKRLRTFLSYNYTADTRTAAREQAIREEAISVSRTFRNLSPESQFKLLDKCNSEIAKKTLIGTLNPEEKKAFQEAAENAEIVALATAVKTLWERLTQ